MFCESYRQPLIDAAVSGEALPHQVAAHLSGCSACSSAFAEEQALFVAIDRSLHVAANADIPASLVPSVRVALPETEFSARRLSWRAVLVPMAAFLLATTVVLTPRFISRNKSNGSGLASSSSDFSFPPEKSTLVTAMSTRDSFRRKPLQNHRLETRQQLNSGSELEPSKRLAIAQLVRIAREHPKVAESLSRKSAADFVEIKPIEVAEIHWEPLASDAGGKK